MSALLARLAADTAAEDRRTLVLVGVTGDGKSSTGNTLVGTQQFAVSGGLSSVTQSVDHADYFFEGRCYRVIDTVGLHDTGLGKAEVIRRFEDFSSLAAAGIDCFLFILKWGRCKPEHEAALDAFVRNCGELALEHTLVVFTHCNEPPEAVKASLVSAPRFLQALLPKVAGVVAVDNVSAPEAARSELHSRIEGFVSKMPKPYSNAALADARKASDSREEEERQAFAAALADWRKQGNGPITIERSAELQKRAS